MRRIVTLFTTLMLFALLGACAAPAVPSETTSAEITGEETTSDEASDTEDSHFPLTITDALGQELTLEEPPIIGCDWYGCYETFADLGITLHAAAMTSAMLDTDFYSPVGPPDHLIEDLTNPELWAATDMTLMLSRVPDDAYWDTFREMVPVFFLHHPSYGKSGVTGYQSYVENARLLGQLTGETEAADAAIARFETMIDNLRALSTPELAEQTVGFIWSGEGYYSIATDNPVCTLLAETGLGNCMGTGIGRSVEYNPEEVLALDPDVIIYMLEGESAGHIERTDPIWAELTAVKEGRVFDAIGTRYMCCSMRGLVHSMQEYVHHVVPKAGIPAPGPEADFDPTMSPLVQGSETEAEAEANDTASTAADTACEEGFRFFDHELLATEPTCIPENPERVAYLIYPSYLYALDVNPIGAWGLERDAENYPFIADWVMEGTIDHGMPPNLETLLGLQPDLLLYDMRRVEDVVEELQQIAPLVTFDVNNAFTWQERHLFNAAVFDKVALAEEQIAAYEARAAELRAAIQASRGDVSDVTVSLVRIRDAGEINLLGPWYPAVSVVEDVGFDLPDSVDLTLAGMEEAHGSIYVADISEELIPTVDGDIMLVFGSPGGGTVDVEESGRIMSEIGESPLWQTLDAVQAGEVYFKGDYWLQPSILTAHLVIDELAEILDVELETTNPFLGE